MAEFDDKTHAILDRLAGDPKTHAKILATITLTPTGNRFVMRGLKRLLKAFELSQYVLEAMSGGSPTWSAANEKPISRKDATSFVGGLSRIAGRKVEFKSLLDKHDHQEKAPPLLQNFQWRENLIVDVPAEIEGRELIEDLMRVAVGLADEVVVASRRTNVGIEFSDLIGAYKARVANTRDVAIADILLRSAEAEARRIVSKTSVLGRLLGKLSKNHKAIVDMLPDVKRVIEAGQDPRIEKTPTPREVDKRLERLRSAMEPFLEAVVAERLAGIAEVGTFRFKSTDSRPQVRRARLIICADFVSALLRVAERVPSAIAVADTWLKASKELAELWQFLASFLH